MKQKYTLESCRDKMRELSDILREQAFMIEVVGGDAYLGYATQEQMRINRALLELYIAKFIELNDKIRETPSGYRAGEFHDLEWGKQNGTDWNLDGQIE